MPNEAEAKLVRHIFRRFVELGSGTLLVKELKLDGATSKAWTTQDGRVRDGKPIDKTLIYKLIHNRTYLGELKHRDEWVQGEHPAIISRDVWSEVHTILATNGRVRGNTTPRANMTCDTYPREISEQRGRYDDQPAVEGPDARSEGFCRSGRIARSPQGD